MTKAFLIAIALILWTDFAQAQTVDKIELYEYGIYTSPPGLDVDVTRHGVMSIGFAHAQTVQKIEIYEFGTYTSAPEVQIGWSHQGLRHSLVEGIDLIDQTETIVARIGVDFGFRFRVIGSALGPPVHMKVVTRFPPPGVFAPKGSVPFVIDDVSWMVSVGENSFLIWPFEKRSDLISGIWTFELWIDGKKFAEQKFNVILPPISQFRKSQSMLWAGEGR